MSSRAFPTFVALRYLRGAQHGYSAWIAVVLAVASAAAVGAFLALSLGPWLGLYRSVETFGGAGVHVHARITNVSMLQAASAMAICTLLTIVLTTRLLQRQKGGWVVLVVLLAAACFAPLWLALLHSYGAHTMGLAFFSDAEIGRFAVRVLGITAGAGSALIAILLGLLVLRRLFSFYTTVSITGVWIGTTALVIAVAFLTGIQKDRRAKLLGVNAHIQLRPKAGELADWENLASQIRLVPGVSAVSPYTVTDVIVSAGNPTAVMLRGIEPERLMELMTTMRFTEDGQHSLPAAEAIRRLLPLVETEHDSDRPSANAPANLDDTAPSDMPIPSIPKDMSGVRPTSPNVTHSAPTFDQAPDSAGTAFVRRAETLPGLWIGTSLNKTAHLAVGQEVRIVSPLTDPSNPDATGMPIPYHRDFRVAALFSTDEIEFDTTVMFVALDEFWQFFDRAETIDCIDVRVKHLGDVAGIVTSLHHVTNDAVMISTWQDSNRSLFSAFELEKIALACVLAIIILVASFSIVATLVLVIIEKNREIGLLKTLGATDRGVVEVFVTQGVAIGTLGTLLGLAYGLAICAVFYRYPIPVNADVYFMSTLPVDVQPLNIAIIALIGPLVSAAATIYPAWSASRVRPADALRW